MVASEKCRRGKQDVKQLMVDLLERLTSNEMDLL